MKIKVCDNFQFMREDYTYTLPDEYTFEAALEICRAMVDDDLMGSYKPGMSAEELYSLYMLGGDDPIIIGPREPGQDFSAWDYAKQRAKEIVDRDTGSG